MSAPTVVTTLANVDPNQANPANLQGLIDILNPLLVSEITGEFVPYILDSSTPAVSDNDKAWLKVDSAGRPLGIYKYYNGAWRQFYTGSPSEVKMFSGDPALYFDGTGLGLTTAEWDGWALCNGDNGTVDLTDKFVIGGGVYTAGWTTAVSGTAVTDGGAPNYTIVNTNLPNMTVQLSGRVGYDDNASGSGQDPAAIVTKKWYGNPTPAPIPILATFGADPNGTPAVPQVPVPSLPPFLALAFVQFVGYA